MISTHLGQLFQQHADSHPESIALLSTNGAALTYRALNTQIRYVADTLNAYGICRSDRIAIVVPNGPEMAVAFLTVAACATSAPLNPGYRAEEFNFFLDDLGAAAVIVDAGSRSIVRDVARRRQLPVLELQPVTDTAGLFLLSGKTGRDPRHTGLAEPGDIAIVLHTSGTTARPKIVPLSQANICASAAQIQRSLELTPADRCLNVMPLFHIHGLIGALLSSLHARGSVCCTPGFSSESFPRWLAQSGATWYTAVPTMHHDLVQDARIREIQAEPHRLRFIRSCSSPLPPHLMTDLERAFQVPVVEAYGMTECSHQIAVNPLPPAARKPGSVGLPSGTDVAVLGDSGDLVPRRATGEIAVRGGSVMSGYAGHGDANRRAFVDGWFRTGDQGYLDEDGYIFITGRLKEIINRGGEKIAPREVDEILLLHPAVAQCVTFAAPHPTLGEEVAAAVVLRAGERATPQQIQEFASNHISEFKVPRRIVMLDALPKGPTGKLQRVGLAERLGVTFHLLDAGAGRVFTKPVDDREAALAETMAHVLGLPSVGTTDGFFDLGGTSLHAAELVCAVRARYGWKLTLTHVYRRPTVKDLAALLPTLETAESQQLEDPERSLLRFNPEGHLPPLVFLHGSTEAAVCCSELALQCGPDQPIFVLPAHGAIGEPIPPTVEEMAAESLKAVRSLGTPGPYVIAGFCRSAPVALELARQLELSGEQVKTLVVIDAAIENTHVAMRWLKRFVGIEGGVRGLSAAARLERFLALRRACAGMERWLLGRPKRRTPIDAGDAIGDAYRRAREAYVPVRYRGRVLFLTPAHEVFDTRWLKVAPDLELAELPGTHATCLTEHLPAVCGHLKRALTTGSGVPGLRQVPTANSQLPKKSARGLRATVATISPIASNSTPRV